jgi:hypothetical protein
LLRESSSRNPEAPLICSLCEQEKDGLAEDEICLDCLAKYLEDFPHETEDIICSDFDVQFDESTEFPTD